MSCVLAYPVAPRRSAACAMVCVAVLWLAPFAWSQQPDGSSNKADSLDLYTQKLDTALARRLGEVWPRFSAQQRQMLRNHTARMVRKKYPEKTRRTGYYGALVSAVEGGLSPDDYLAVTDRVIEEGNVLQAAAFFQRIANFFPDMRLHADRYFTLTARDVQYRLEYADTPPPVLEASVDQADYDDYASDDVADVPDTPTLSAVPVWFNPEPIEKPRGPVLVFDRVNIELNTPYDSVAIEGTGGVFSLTEGVFVGNKGRMNWSAAGLSGDSVFFEFDRYRLHVGRPTIDEARGHLTYVGMLPGRVEGLLTFKSQARAGKEPVYPAFVSLGNKVTLPGLQVHGVRYMGGFSLQGRQIEGHAVNEGRATLEISDQAGVTRLQVSAPQMGISFADSTLASDKAAVTIYQRGDSIYNASIRFWYNFSTHQLSLRTDRGQDNAYRASYFNMSFLADRLTWDLHADSLRLYAAGGRGQAPMTLESNDFYDQEDFRILAGYGFPFHPLVMAVNYTRARGTDELYAADLAQYARCTLEEAQAALVFLAGKNLIDYDPVSGYGKLTQHAVSMLDAYRGERDYDNLKIHSVVDGPDNALLSFDRGEMRLSGIERMKISDSLNVVIYPDSSTVTLLKNRAMRFDGRISAGSLDVYGKDFAFDYEGFSVNLNHIDSIQFYITEVDRNGRSTRRRINNAVIGGSDSTATAGATKRTSGTLYINRTDNKSGRIRLPNYPRMDDVTGGVIFFDRNDILHGVYDRSVFYRLPPFDLDSLNALDNPSIRFKGTFVAGKIFPPFEEPLSVRTDRSMGFTHAIPAEGYPMFGQSGGRAMGVLNMSKQGLRLDGAISYLVTSLRSNNFVCYPDSVTAITSPGSIVEQRLGEATYPDVTLPESRLKWIPSRNLFALSNLSDPFALYQSSATFSGQMLLSKGGLHGAGKLSTRGFEAVSRRFFFGASNFEARHSRFQLSVSGTVKPALAGKDVRLAFDLARNQADISPEVAGAASLEFPYAQFKTSIPEARWYLNDQKVIMKRKPETPLEESYFYATNKELDSLNFMAESAEYDIAQQRLSVRGIPFIKVADAKIIPKGNQIDILENAKIGQLEQATVIVDTLNGYHRLIDATIDIISRTRFNGRATYQYVNTKNDTFAIKMTDFKSQPMEDKKRLSQRAGGEQVAEETVASGLVVEEDHFLLAPGILYKGNVIMYATRPALQLNGSVHLELRNIDQGDVWIAYEQSGDEKKIMLDFDKAMTEDGQKVRAGLHFDDRGRFYTTFASEKNTPSDQDFFMPGGMLFYDEESQTFHIEDLQRAAGEKFTGKIFTYNDAAQAVEFAGKVNLIDPTLQPRGLTIDASAIGSGNLKTDDLQMNALLAIYADIPGAALDLMGKDLQEAVEQENLEEGSGDPVDLLHKIAPFVGDEATRDFEARSEQQYTSLTTLPPLAKSILLTDVTLKYSTAHRAFYSSGRIGLSNVLSQDVNGLLEGFFETKTTEDGGSSVNLFIKASPDAWYYFGVENGRLLVNSSNDQFNTLIVDKARGGHAAFAPADDDETLAFVNRFRADYYDITAPYQLEGSSILDNMEENAPTDNDGF